MFSDLKTVSIDRRLQCQKEEFDRRFIYEAERQAGDLSKYEITVDVKQMQGDILASAISPSGCQRTSKYEVREGSLQETTF